MSVLPYGSVAVIVRVARRLRSASAEPVTTEAVAAAALTVSPELPEIEPSVTETVGLSALYSFITPLFAPATVATPLVNVIVVAVPKLVAAPVLSLTVGVVAGFVELFAPLNVRLWSPV